MGAPQYEQAGADIGGTGTTNTIPRWTGPSTLGDSVITQDTTTGVNIRVNAATSVYATANRTALELNGTTSSLLGFAVGGVASGYLTASASSMLLTAGASRPLQLGASNAIGMTFDTSNNVGIGTASPAQKLSLQVAGAVYQRFNNSTYGGSWDIGMGASGEFSFNAAGIAERARFDSAGRLLVGTSTAPNSANVRSVLASSVSVYAGIQNTGSNVGCAFGVGSANFELYTSTLAYGSESYVARMAVSSAGTAAQSQVAIGTSSFTSGCSLTVAQSIDVSQSAQGLKLPATPGNADTQTLDCYQEGTWAPTLTGFGGTNPTVTASYTRVGRLVTIAVQIDATGGNQYSMTLGTTTITTPAGMTASSICAVPVVDGGVANRGIASVWTTGIIYLPTVALTTASTFFVATYRV